MTMLRTLLDISPPSVCGILRNGPYDTRQHFGSSNSGGPAARRKKMDLKDDNIDEVGVQLPTPTAMWK